MCVSECGAWRMERERERGKREGGERREEIKGGGRAVESGGREGVCKMEWVLGGGGKQQVLGDTEWEILQKLWR